MAMCAVLITTLAGAVIGFAGCGAGRGDESSRPVRTLDPDGFAGAIAEPGRVLINVHVPDQGSIAGTDLWIPFDEISTSRGELPEASTALAVYCRSGAMSAEAAETLARLGFTDIVDLGGGMLAWRDSGRALFRVGA